MRMLALAAIAALAQTLALAGAAHAHPATEQFIPIGQSPGANSAIGQLEPVAEPASGRGDPVVAITAPDGPHSYVIGPNTRIYVDHSAQGMHNTLGTIEDLQAGHVAEVAIADPDTRVALWIKVRANPPTE